MNILLWILVGSFTGFFIFLLKAIIDGKKDPPEGTVITYKEDPFTEDEMDRAIKSAVLRQKLKKIEEERAENSSN